MKLIITLLIAFIALYSCSCIGPQAAPTAPATRGGPAATPVLEENVFEEDEEDITSIFESDYICIHPCSDKCNTNQTFVLQIIPLTPSKISIPSRCSSLKQKYQFNMRFQNTEKLLDKLCTVICSNPSFSFKNTQNVTVPINPNEDISVELTKQNGGAFIVNGKISTPANLIFVELLTAIAKLLLQALVNVARALIQGIEVIAQGIHNFEIGLQRQIVAWQNMFRAGMINHPNWRNSIIKTINVNRPIRPFKLPLPLPVFRRGLGFFRPRAPVPVPVPQQPQQTNNNGGVQGDHKPPTNDGGDNSNNSNDSGDNTGDNTPDTNDGGDNSNNSDNDASDDAY